MLLAFVIAAALVERATSGWGQVIDAAIVDGKSALMTIFAGLVQAGHIAMERDANMLGGAAPFYRCYLCADGGEMAVGAIEPHFYAKLLDRIGTSRDLLARQHDRARWTEDSATLAALFAARPLAEWTVLLEGTDGCAAPVVPLAAADPHMRARCLCHAGRYRTTCPGPLLAHARRDSARRNARGAFGALARRTRLTRPTRASSRPNRW